MSTGLKFKGVPVSIGGLNIQPMRTQAQLAADPTVATPVAVDAAFHGDIKRGAFVEGGIVQLNTAKTERVRLIAERGVNVFRPEIIAATRLLPVFSGDRGSDVSDAGFMLDAQLAARSVRADNIGRFIDKLSQDGVAGEIIEKLRSEFASQLDRARDDVKYMVDTYTVVDRVLRRLDVYGERTRVKEQLTQAIGGVVFGLDELFVDHMGFSDEGFRHFTNTKIFVQLSYDLGNATRRYTPGLFGIIDADRPNDDDPVKCDRTPTFTDGKFSFDMADFARRSHPINAFRRTNFNRFMNSLPDARSDRCKLLSATISRLLGISSALGTTRVQTDLNVMRVSATDDDPIAAVIGVPGDTVLDDANDDVSLVSVGRISDTDVGDVVLPFERRQVVDDSDGRFVPGADYFFDGLMGSDERFDVTRLVDFDSKMLTRVKAATNIVEAALRMDTPYAKTMFGSRNAELRGVSVFDAAATAAARVLTLVEGNDATSRNIVFILSIITLSQSDRQLRHLLFQLFALSIIYSDLKQVNATTIELIASATANELKTYGDLPALADYTTNVPIATIEGSPVGGNPLLPDGEQAIAQETNVGLMPTTAVNVVGTAYKQLQRLVIDRVFSVLAARSPGGNLGAFHGNVQVAAVVAQTLNAQFTALALNAVGSVGGAAVQVPRPTADQTFDDDFRSVMFAVARFIDELEDVASRGGDPGGVRADRHLLDDGTGRTRYLPTSASMRMLYAFELVMTMLGSYDFAKFGGLSPNENDVQVVYNRTKIRSFAKAAVTPLSPVVSTLLAQYQQTLLASGGRLGPAAVEIIDRQIVGVFQNAMAGNVDDGLVKDYIAELSVVRDALILDLNVVRSMTQTLRKLASGFDAAVDKARVFFDDPTYKHGLTFPLMTLTTSFLASQGQQSQVDTQAKAADVDVRERHARRVLSSREQAALSLVQLRELAEFNSAFSPLASRAQAKQGGETTDAFIDGTRVKDTVQAALWSMLSEPRFRGVVGGTVKVLSVGIPAGFNERLETSDRLRPDDTTGTRVDRQLDVVTLVVHRRDCVEDDIVFKPRRYVFEMSRFVSQFSFEKGEAPDIVDGKATPMSFSSLLSEGVRLLDVSSFSEADIVGQLGAQFIDDERYEFMDEGERRSLVFNHVVSYLMSVYIRMMSGVDIREQTFLVEPAALQLQSARATDDAFKALIERVVELSGVGLSLRQLRDKFSGFDALLTSIESTGFNPGVLEQHRIFDIDGLEGPSALVSAELTDIVKLKGSRSIMTGGEKIRRSVTSPKVFERVFHIPVDPYEFEIDVDQTQKSVSGRAAFVRLQRQGRLDISRGNVTLKRPAVGTDIVVDQYFVVVERFEGRSRRRRSTGRSRVATFSR